MLQNIRIILVATSHSGNIGSSARAMKTMGLTNLYLVAPQSALDSQAIALAAGASDVIGHATVVNTLDDALMGCSLVIGTSARSRTLSWPVLEPRPCAVLTVREAEHAPVALVFGSERMGLTNDELQKCHYHVVIPANPDYSSLNLAMAVQILAYEIRCAFLAKQQIPAIEQQKSVSYPLADDMERFYQHLEQVLCDIGFLRQGRQGQIMRKLRRLFTRVRLQCNELSILRGILDSVEKQKSKNST